MSHQTATFAAGCFWGPEASFRLIPGVIQTQVGYIGGHVQDPSYEQVCTGQTGHAEAVQLSFDPEQVSYRQLLETFWMIHDPTQHNRQGPDVGSQYRSAIFYHDEQQREEAEQSKRELEASGKLSRPVATEIVEAGPFYRAEEYHQCYLDKSGRGACGG